MLFPCAVSAFLIGPARVSVTALLIEAASAFPHPALAIFTMMEDAVFSMAFSHAKISARFHAAIAGVLLGRGISWALVLPLLPLGSVLLARS